MGRRHLLPPHGKGILLPCRGYGLGEPPGALLSALEQVGCFVLYKTPEEAIEAYGAPGIFNTDEGSQFTSEEFTRILLKNNIRISIDGQSCWMDNVFIERLWSVKYEEVYLEAYGLLTEARKELGAYFRFYNERRRHQGFDGKTPDEVYWGTLLGVRAIV